MTERARNRRGEGTRLRAEILRAAAALLEQSGSEESVTLRAVARSVGIAPPSIYAHFPDRETIIDAVIDEAFGELTAELGRVIDPADDPVGQLLAGCAAYLEFAKRQPNRYRVLFQRQELSGPGAGFTPVRESSFRYLANAVQLCIDSGRSASTDAFGDACAIWVALHGYATLSSDLCSFPWPPEQAMRDRIVLGLAKISAEKVNPDKQG
jgi:AcrR family transcriptional regulator